MAVRVGIGYDIHALRRGRPLLLGGVRLAHPFGLAGHSDGDVLWHAVIDAVLGALGAGDIGEHFPDTDPRWKGAPGERFAAHVAVLAKKRRLRVAYVDAVVIAEAPKLGPYKARMRANIARAFGLAVSDVNVKGKTNEGFGEVGKRRAIACHAVAGVERI